MTRGLVRATALTPLLLPSPLPPPPPSFLTAALEMDDTMDTIHTDEPTDTNTDTAPDADGGPGWLVTRLAELPPAALLDECQLAGLLGCHRCSIRRGHERGELPAPVRVLGKACWTAGHIIRHIEARLEAAEADAERERARIARLGA
jgi:hypothetical protein